MRAIAGHLPFRVHPIEVTLPDGHASAGRARRIALEHADDLAGREQTDAIGRQCNGLHAGRAEAVDGHARYGVGKSGEQQPDADTFCSANGFAEQESSKQNAPDDAQLSKRDDVRGRLVAERDLAGPLDVPFTFDAQAVIVTVAGGGASTMLFGLIGAVGALSARPARRLRAA